MSKKLFVPAIALVLSACQTSGGGAPVADVGNQVPPNYRAVIQQFFKENLSDPYSVRDAEISNPTVVFVGLINGGTAPGVCVRLNAKNGFGGYTGLQTKALSFSNGVVIRAPTPMFDSCKDVSWLPFSELNGKESGPAATTVGGLPGLGETKRH